MGTALFFDRFGKAYINLHSALVDFIVVKVEPSPAYLYVYRHLVNGIGSAWLIHNDALCAPKGVRFAT